MYFSLLLPLLSSSLVAFSCWLTPPSISGASRLDSLGSEGLGRAVLALAKLAGHKMTMCSQAQHGGATAPPCSLPLPALLVHAEVCVCCVLCALCSVLYALCSVALCRYICELLSEKCSKGGRSVRLCVCPTLYLVCNPIAPEPFVLCLLLSFLDCSMGSMFLISCSVSLVCCSLCLAAVSSPATPGVSLPSAGSRGTKEGGGNLQYAHSGTQRAHTDT